MTLKTVVVFAASLWLMGVILLSNSSSEEADTEKARQPFRIQNIEIPSSIRGEKVTSATLSGNGLLALGTAGGRVSIVDRNLRPWRGGWERSAAPSEISRLAFSYDGVALAAVTNEAVLVWRLDDQKVAKIPVKKSPSAMALSSGGRWLAVAHFDISVFDVLGQRLVHQFKQEDQEGGNDVYDALAFTPDAAIVVAASVSITDAWNVESGKKVQHWSCECDANGVAFSSDAALAALGTGDAHALLWDVASAKLLKDKTVSVVAGDHVYGTAVSLKGTLVFAGTASGSLVIWDTRSGVIVARAELSGQPLVQVKSSDDGQILLVERQKAEYVRGSYDRWLITLAGADRAGHDAKR
jgi:WD40 repeat protein